MLRNAFGILLLCLPSFSAAAWEPASLSDLTPLGFGSSACGTVSGENGQHVIAEAIELDRSDSETEVRLTALDNMSKKVAWRRAIGRAKGNTCKIVKNAPGEFFVAFVERDQKRLGVERIVVWQISANGEIGRAVRYSAEGEIELIGFSRRNDGKFVLLINKAGNQRNRGDPEFAIVSKDGKVVLREPLPSQSGNGRGRRNFRYRGLELLGDKILIFGSEWGAFSPADGMMERGRAVLYEETGTRAWEKVVPEGIGAAGLEFAFEAAVSRSSDIVLAGRFQNWSQTARNDGQKSDGVHVVALEEDGQVRWAESFVFSKATILRRSLLMTKLSNNGFALAADLGMLKSRRGAAAWLAIFDSRGRLKKTWRSRARETLVMGLAVSGEHQINMIVHSFNGTQQTQHLSFETD